MKKTYVDHVKAGENIKEAFMVMKKLYRDGINTVVILGDKTGDFKAAIKDAEGSIEVGDVIQIEGKYQPSMDVVKYSKVNEFKLEDYLPVARRPIEDMMNEMEAMSNEEFKSKECIALNDYFFKNEDFLEKFKRGIGGVSQHHNYLGGLAEHTLNVMHLAKTMADRYECRNREIAILGAKLHDIGKVEEYSVNGPFQFTFRGDMEGHIVMGVQMLEDAFRADPDAYSEEFRERMKGCIVQHHGKLEYGSPKKPNLVESYIVHYADYVDANMNKIEQVTKGLEPGTWSPYDRRLESKIYV